LDPRQIIGVRTLIDELGGERTIVLSTHILAEAQQICDRVLIINRGRIVAEDTPEELRGRLAGGERIRVRLSPALDTETAKAALAAVQGVDVVEPAGDGLFNVTAAAGTNARPDIAETIVGRGWPLLELTPVGMTLEEIFLELTTTDQEAMELDDQEAMDGDVAEEADDE
jgi:ABC-2 type transport system ATP-binding protein